MKKLINKKKLLMIKKRQKKKELKIKIIMKNIIISKLKK